MVKFVVFRPTQLREELEAFASDVRQETLRALAHAMGRDELPAGLEHDVEVAIEKLVGGLAYEFVRRAEWVNRR